MKHKNDKNTNKSPSFVYLKTYIFYGLKNLNDGFDTSSIYYFSESEFEIVLERVEKNGLGIYGIEPWINGSFYDVKIVEDYSSDAIDPKWYKTAFTEFKQAKKGLMYAATYFVPEHLLK